MFISKSNTTVIATTTTLTGEIITHSASATASATALTVKVASNNSSGLSQNNAFNAVNALIPGLGPVGISEFSGLYEISGGTGGTTYGFNTSTNVS